VNFPEAGAVSLAKVQELRARIARLNIRLSDVDESFARGSGKGGQKINKTSNAVTLRYAPLGLTVRCQRERERSLNRFLALRELVDQIEMRTSPETSVRRQEWERLRRQKDRRRRRSG
jgi:protein subunit release factor B